MYAIQNIKTGKFVYGTDYRYYPHHQKTSHNRVLTWDDLRSAKVEFKCRKCGKDYRIVVLKTVEVKRVIDFDQGDDYDLGGGSCGDTESD